MTDVFKVEWFPPGGEPFTWQTDSVNELLDIDGVTSTAVTLHKRKSPGQRGETATGKAVGGRTVTAAVRLTGKDRAEFNQRRAALVAALADSPTLPGAPVDLGVLRVHLEGVGPVETFAAPVDSPRRLAKPNGVLEDVEVEWDCPSPLWWDVADRVVVLEATEQGWESPWESPWESISGGFEGEIVNPSHVPVPMLVRFWGPQDGARLTQMEGADGGKAVAVTGAISGGTFVEVDTGVVRRNVTLVDSGGARTPALGRWDFDGGTFLQVPPGVSRWRWEPGVSELGSRCVLIWRPARAGW